jgi:hypothetical protein
MSKTPTPYPLLVLVVLTLAGLACSLSAPSQAANLGAAIPTASPSPTSEPTPPPTPTASPQPDPGGRCSVIAHALNIRACPGVDCAIIGGLLLGQTVDTAPAADGWLQLADGGGYIVGRYCKDGSE